jgi:hypothetical protein
MEDVVRELHNTRPVGNFEYYFTVFGMILIVVCQLITWCYPFEDKSPISKKEWDSAAEGSEQAVESGQTRVFAIGEDLDGLKERQRAFAYTNDESYAPPLPPAASKDGSTSINNRNLADDQPSPADLLSFAGQDGDGNLNQPISLLDVFAAPKGLNYP